LCLIQPATLVALSRVQHWKPKPRSCMAWAHNTRSRDTSRCGLNIEGWCTRHRVSTLPASTQAAGRKLLNHQPASSSAFNKPPPNAWYGCSTKHPCHSQPIEHRASLRRSAVLGNFGLEYQTEPPECHAYPWCDRPFFKSHPHVWAQVETLIETRIASPIQPVQTEVATQLIK